jgi:hypothetical protein
MAENLDPDSINRANEQLENLATNTESVNQNFGQTKNVSEDLIKALKEVNKQFGDLIKVSKSELIKNLDGLSDSVEDLTEDVEKAETAQDKYVKQLTASIGFVKDASGKYVSALEQQAKERKAIEDEINKQIGKENVLRVQQESLLAQQLQSLGVARDENGNWVKTTIELNAAQKEQLNQAKQFIERDKAQRDSGRGILGMAKASNTFEGAVGAAGNSLLDMAEKAGINRTGYIALGLGIEAITIGLTGMKKILDASIDAQANYVKALLSGQRGQALEARRNEEVGKAVNSVIKQFGELAISAGVAGTALSFLIPGGFLIKAFTAALGLGTVALGVYTQYTAKAADKALEFATQLAELKDKIFEGFNTLGDASLSTATGMTGLTELMKSLRMSSADVGKFTSIVKGATKDLAMLGPGTIEGLERFTKTASQLINSQLGEQLRLMGITNDKQAEHVLKFMTQQERLGFSQERINKNLAQTAGKYIKELDALAVLTGATREEQEKARDAIMASEEMRAKLLTAKDDKEREKIQKQIDYITALQSAGLKDLAEGATRYFAAGGRIVDESSQKFALSMRETSKRVLRGEGDTLDNLMRGAQEALAANKRLAGIAAIDKTSVSELVGSFVQIVDANQRFEKIREEAVKKGQDPNTAARKYLEDLINKRVATDKQTKEQVNLIEKQRLEAIKREDTVLKDFGTAVGLFKEGVDAFGKYTDRLKDQPKDQRLVTEQGKVAAGLRDKATEKAVEIASLDDKIKELERQRRQAIIDNKSQAERDRIDNELKKLREDKVKAEQEEIEAARKARQAELEAQESRRQQKLLEGKKQNAEKKLISLTDELAEKRKNLVDTEKELEKYKDKKDPSSERYKKTVENYRNILKDNITAHEGYINNARKEIERINAELQRLAPRVPSSTATPSSASSAPGAAPPAAPSAPPSAATPASPGAAPNTAPSTATPASSTPGAAPGTTPEKEKTTDSRKVFTRKQLEEQGLKLKKGDVQRDDGILDPRLIELAKKIQSNVPHFSYFSSFNDQFHTKYGGSHTEGLGLDFVLSKTPSKKDGQELVKELIANGAKYAQDEYNNPSKYSTGGHIHAEIAKARYGGLFSGPDSGYPVMLHGKEAVIPINKPTDLNQVAKTELPKMDNSQLQSSFDRFFATQTEFMGILSNKLDSLDNRLARSNDIQENILTYSAG